jgi:hypothetical protein
MAAIGTYSSATFKFRDNSNENARTRLHFVPLDTSADNSGLLGALGSIPVFGTALIACSDAVFAGTDMSVKLDNGSAGLPADEKAQREMVARMQYQDTVTGKFYHFDIPAPNSLLITSGSDAINIATGPGAALKVAFDAECISEDGNPVVLVGGHIAGRRR